MFKVVSVTYCFIFEIFIGSFSKLHSPLQNVCSHDQVVAGERLNKCGELCSIRE